MTCRCMLFGEWTTLPAGPATLAARTRALIVPVVARRRADGSYDPFMYEPIEVADTTAAAIGRATQAVAEALEDMISRGARPVVHLQADVARDRGRGRRPGPARQELEPHA